MRRRRHLLSIKGGRRVTAWLALVCLLASLVVGVVHHLPRQAQAAQSIELCTIDGIQVVQLDADGKPIEAPAHKLTPCPICLSLQTTSTYVATAPIAVLPPAPHLLAVVADETGLHLALDQVLPRHSRAPPQARLTID